MVGTLNYRAPEIILDERQGFEVDLWALGCILFKMVTGKVPFPGIDASVGIDITSRNIQWPA